MLAIAALALAAAPLQDAVPVPLERKALLGATRACEWLASRQLEDGHWSAEGKGPEDAAARTADDEFWDRALSGATPDSVDTGPSGSNPLHDVGVTGLATLALLDLGAGGEGPYGKAAGRALDWLVSRQDPESGLIGERLGVTFHYEHAIASLALASGLRETGRDDLAEPCKKAVDYILRARNPYRVWRYDMPPTGDNDTSVTTWMTLALAEAERAGLAIDRSTKAAVIEWIDAMTDERTGVVGYVDRGSASSRVPGMNQQFATDKTATLTAAGLLCRLELGQDPTTTPAIVSHVRHILRTLPEAPLEAIDDSLWLYFGTRSMRALGSRPWQLWSKTMIPSILGAQAASSKVDGVEIGGSWEPTGAWGFSTGRTGTTALMALALGSAASATDSSAERR